MSSLRGSGCVPCGLGHPCSVTLVLTVVKPEAIYMAADSRVTRRADLLDEPRWPRTPGGADLSPQTVPAGMRRLILMIALWLVAIGIPVAETKLSLPQQTVITNEIANIALALAVTWRMMDNRRK
jgi:hypothetical protein